LRQVDAVIVADLDSAQCGLHRTAVAAGNVEEAEGRRENVVQSLGLKPTSSRRRKWNLTDALERYQSSIIGQHAQVSPRLNSTREFLPIRAETAARGQGTWFDIYPGRAACY
jgi:hypothetical protein